MYEIYTDGAYSSSKDAGGTSAIILKDIDIQLTIDVKLWLRLWH